jgi:hypothetical protein
MNDSFVDLLPDSRGDPRAIIQGLRDGIDINAFDDVSFGTTWFKWLGNCQILTNC